MTARWLHRLIAAGGKSHSANGLQTTSCIRVADRKTDT